MKPRNVREEREEGIRRTAIRRKSNHSLLYLTREFISTWEPSSSVRSGGILLFPSQNDEGRSSCTYAKQREGELTNRRGFANVQPLEPCVVSPVQILGPEIRIFCPVYFKDSSGMLNYTPSQDRLRHYTI